MHAASLAAEQHVTATPRGGRALVGRVQDNRRALRQAHRNIASAVREGQEITPAAEWLVDNFHVVDEQLREIRDDLPSGYYRELPKLADGSLIGYPRVYGLAWEFVAHTDSHLDLEVLRRFVLAYQRVQSLTIGELWAVAITLRIVLVENLRRLADAIVQLRELRAIADEVADDLIGPDGHGGERLTSTLRRVERSPLGSAFVVELVQRLRQHDPAVTPALVWVNQRLARDNTTADEIVRTEHQRQAAMTVTVRNIITSMRLLSAVDWTEFVESVSSADAVLRQGSLFGAMDFAGRDSYRHAIEELARGSERSEIDVARMAIELCVAAGQTAPPTDPIAVDRERDPGYYLVGNGRPLLEQQIGFRPTVRQRVTRMIIGAGAPGYIGAIATLTLLIAAVPVWIETNAGEPLGPLLAFGACAVLLASGSRHRHRQSHHHRNWFRRAHFPGFSCSMAQRHRSGPWSCGADPADQCVASIDAMTSSDSRCTISPIRTAMSGLHCSPTGATPSPRRIPTTQCCLAGCGSALRDSMSAMGRQRTVVRDSSCCTAAASGTRGNRNGWGGSASAASWKS